MKAKNGVDPKSEIRRLRETVFGFCSSRILLSANNIGIFEFIGGSGLSSNEIAAGMGLHQRGVDLFLRALVALKFLTYEDGKFFNTTVAKNLFLRGGPYYQGHILKLYDYFWHNWSHLDRIMLDGIKGMEQIPYRFPHVFSTNRGVVDSYIRGMQEVAKVRFKDVVDHIDLNNVTTVLDVGGGHGLYSIGMALKKSDVKVTVFDLDYSQPVVEENTKRFSVSERVKFIVGDYTKDDFAGPYDLILLSNILRGHNMGEGITLLRKTYDTLKEDGMLVIQDTVSDSDKEMESIYAAIHSINMLVNTTGGKIYTHTEFEGMLKSSGYGSIQSVKVDDLSSLITARKKTDRTIQ